jgi:HSP20 family protein
MTTIIRWNPLRDFATVQGMLDRAYETTWRLGTLNSGVMHLDIHESDTAYTVYADLPGLTAEQINVRYHDGVLRISAEVAQPSTADGTRVLMQERPFGKVSRSIQLPQTVDTDHVEATYENGVLKLTLPKTPEAQPKQITVKSHNGLLQSTN